MDIDPLCCFLIKEIVPEEFTFPCDTKCVMYIQETWGWLLPLVYHVVLRNSNSFNPRNYHISKAPTEKVSGSFKITLSVIWTSCLEHKPSCPRDLHYAVWSWSCFLLTFFLLTFCFWIGVTDHSHDSLEGLIRYTHAPI